MSLGTMGKFVIFVPGGAPPSPPFYGALHIPLLNWVNKAGNGPSMLDNVEPVMLYDKDTEQEAHGSCFVPWDYDDNSHLRLFFRAKYDSVSDVSGSNIAKMGLVTGLVKPGEVAVPPFGGNLHAVSSDWVAGSSPGEQLTSPWMSMTDGSGQINGRNIDIGDELHLSLIRDATNVGDTMSDDARVYVNSIEIAQLVVT